MWRFLGRTAIGLVVGGALSLVALGFAIIALALGTAEPVNLPESLGFVAATLLFAFAGQWLMWIRHLVPGADSVAGGSVLMAIGATLTALLFEPSQGAPFVLFLVAAGFLLCGGWLLDRGGRTARTGSAVGALGRDLGFTVAPLRWFHAPSARGAVDGIPVVLSAENARLSIEVANAGFPPELVIAGETLLGLRKEPVVTGDTAFDSTVFLRGGTALLAALDADTRALVKAAVESGAHVKGGVFRHDRDLFLMRDHYSDGGSATKELAESARRMAAIARRLAPTDGVPARLAQNAATDVQPDVRLRNLQALLTDFPTSREAETSCDTALRNRDRALRLVAACHALEHGISRFQKMALGVLEEGHDPRAEALLIEMVRTGEPARVEAALRALRLAGGTKAAEALASFTTHDDRLRLLATEAAKEIRARVSDGGGRLSLEAPGGEGGELSAPDATEGALSEPTAPRATKATT